MVWAQSRSILYRALGITIHKKCLYAAQRELRGEVHSGGRFADASFLTNYRKDVPHLLLAFRKGAGIAVGLDVLEGFARVPDPSFPLFTRGRVREKRVEMFPGTGRIPALE